MRTVSSYFFITLRGPDLENISFGDMLNLRGFLYHIDCQWQVHFSGLWESVMADSNAFILKTKKFSHFLLLFLEPTSNFNHFEKKMIVIVTSFQKLQTVKDLFRPLSKKHLYITPSHSQHVKESQTLAKWAWEQVLHIFRSFWENLIWKIYPSVIL